MSRTIPCPELLARIDLERLPTPSLDGLYELIKAYRVAVPFENLDVLAGRTVSTNMEAIVRKVVDQGRGGWCYELNQLFAELLRGAGFAVKLRLARVTYRRPAPGPLTHLVQLVSMADGQWLVDVGFGGPGPGEPLPLVEGEARCRDGSRFYLGRNDAGGISVSRWMGGKWEQLYEIAPMDVLAIDLEMASHFLSTWEHSPFRRSFMCIAYDGEWNWALEGGELIRRDALWNRVDSTPIDDAYQLLDVLETRFRMRIPVALAQAAWDRVHG